MTTAVGSIEDLIRILDERPEWVEAMRARLLTREHLDLPARLAEFAASAEQNFQAVNRRLDEHSGVLAQHSDALAEQNRILAEHTRILDQHSEILAEHSRVLAQHSETLAEQNRILAEHGRILAEHSRVLGRHTEILDRHTETLAGIQRTLAEHTETLAKHGEIFAQHNSWFKAIRSDLGPIKGWYARSIAVEQAYFLAEDMGLAWVRTLTPPEIGALVRSADLSDLPKNDLRIFGRADLIMETTDEYGGPCYVAVEASFTANGRDTDRAVRNAEILARATGRAARAAVAAKRVDHRIRPRIESGEVFWHELSHHSLEAAAE